MFLKFWKWFQLFKVKHLFRFFFLFFIDGKKNRKKYPRLSKLLSEITLQKLLNLSAETLSWKVKWKLLQTPLKTFFLHDTDLILQFCSTKLFVRLGKVKTSLCSIETSPRKNDDCNQIWSNFSEYDLSNRTSWEL